MSVEDLKKYAEACAKDDALRAKAKEIGAENVPEQIKHAKSLGYNWDENDLQAFAQEMQSKGELSDDDLENVAGGVVTVGVAVGVVGAAAGVATAGAGVASTTAAGGW